MAYRMDPYFEQVQTQKRNTLAVNHLLCGFFSFVSDDYWLDFRYPEKDYM